MTTAIQEDNRTRIVGLEVSNFKKLRTVNIAPKGNLVVIGGKNGAGKTSLIDAVACILGGKDEVPDVPVRRGEDKATIVADLGDIIVRRVFTKEGGTSLRITNREGAVFPSPQAMLDKLTGKISFDPLSFYRMAPKDQRETLRHLVGIDLTENEARRAQLYAERTVLNNDIKRTQAIAEAMPFYAEAPEATVSLTQLSKELEAARAKNREIDQARAHLGELETHLATKNDLLARIDAEIEETEKRLAELRTLRHDQANVIQVEMAKVDEMKDQVAALVEIDTKPIIQRMGETEVLNNKVRANVARADALRAVADKKKNADTITEQIEKLDTEKNATLKAAPFPVNGLGFDERGVTFNGLPLSQASAAEQLRVSVAIGAALNPKLRVLLVRDGSLLDDDSLALLDSIAREKDLQVLVEVVGDDPNVQVLIEDGAVKETREPATEEPQTLEEAKA